MVQPDAKRRAVVWTTNVNDQIQAESARMRVLVSGVGRSGTTLIYRQLAKCMLSTFDATKFHYEPYLWSLTDPKIKGSSFGMDQLSQYGMYVHKATPLFLREPFEIHDEFLDKLYWSETEESPRFDSYLAKVIRGTGRLESYIRRFPDIKIVACLRNPVETINSSLGMFSFLGEEFHEPDGQKLVSEVAADPVFRLPVNQAEWTQLDYSILWWRAHSEELLRVASKHPNNIKLFLFENFQRHGEAELESLLAFLPVASKETFSIGLTDSAGPQIQHSNLTNSDLKQIYPHLQFYFEEVLSKTFTEEQICETEEQILNRVATCDFTEPLAGNRMGLKTPIQLRHNIIAGATAVNRYTASFDEKEGRLPLAQIVSEFSVENRTCPIKERKFRPSNDSPNVEQKTFGCIITCHNDQNTILDSLVSALNQTKPFDKIIVIDDASTDNSVRVLKEFSERYSTVEILELKSNVGVTAARHFGYLNLDTDFVTQLDGDDCFWPTKNYHESKILLEDPNSVAFSDILMLNRHGRNLVSTLEYETDNASVARKLLSRSGGVPRDMTFPRCLYSKINGYDLRVPLFEDLDFKLRLALHTDAKWKRSNAIVGTVYDRRIPSWSADVGFRLSRFAIAHFFRFVDKIGLYGFEAAEAFQELLRPRLDDWAEELFDVLAQSTPESIQNIKSVMLDRRIAGLSDELYASTVKSLSRSPSFNVVTTPWKRCYGVAGNEGPHAGYESEKLHWQTSRNCGFVINPPTDVAGVRGLLYIPHVPEQTLDIRVEQGGRVAKQSFVINGGGKKDDTGNHVLQEVAIPIPLSAGEAKISCTASSYIEKQDNQGELYCLFADWQVFF